jgi:hypothetical protein
MATPPTLQPPFADPPFSGDTTQFSAAWTQHQQALVDQLQTLNAKMGVTDGTDATTGQIGEYLTASGGPITLGSGTAANIATLALPAGDWDVAGNAAFTAAGTTVPRQIGASVSTTSGVLGSIFSVIGATFGVGSFNVIGTGGPVRFSLSAGATAYLVGLATFTVAGMTATGSMWARRVR